MSNLAIILEERINGFKEGDRIKVYGRLATVVQASQFGSSTGYIRYDDDPGIPRCTYVADWKRIKVETLKEAI